jgi:hypothetical protein
MSTIDNQSQLKLTSIRLSANPETKAVEDTDGIDGMINLTKDNRKFYIATFQDPSNPFSTERYRVISQQTDSNDNAVWRAGNPSLIKQFLGKLIPGDIVTKDVKEYTVGTNIVSTYSCVVLKGENIETVFKQQGHELAEADENYDAVLNDINETQDVNATGELESNATAKADIPTTA